MSSRNIVLLVDDHQIKLRYAESELTKAGFLVSTASSGMRALATARSVIPGIIVSDIRMPEMDGYALCRQVRADQNLSDVPIVLYSQFDVDDSLRERAMLEGASAVLTWELNIAPLVSLIRSLLESSQDTTH